MINIELKNFYEEEINNITNNNENNRFNNINNSNTKYKRLN